MDATADARLSELMHVLAAPGATATRWDALVATLTDLGIDQINYGFFDPNAAAEAEASVVFLTTMRDDWMAHYQGQAMHLVDPHVARVRDRRNTPYFVCESDAPRLGGRPQLDFYHDAATAGLRSAFGVPLPARTGSAVPSAGIVFGSTLGEHAYRGAVEGRAPLLTAIGYLFHQGSIGDLARRARGIAPLSPRERDCVAYLADGLRIDAIATRLGIARVTVELHLRGARRKLGTRTLPETVARALLYGEIAN